MQPATPAAESIDAGAAAERRRLLSFAARLRRHHLLCAALAGSVRVGLWCALPAAALIWLVPSWQLPIGCLVLLWMLGGAALAAWRVRGLAAEQLLAVRAATSNSGSGSGNGAAALRDDPELARIGDGLATWLEHEPRGSSRPLLGWLTHELDRAIAALPARRARAAGSRRLVRLRWALVLLVLLVLAWLLLQFWQPPWPGLLGGRPNRPADGNGNVVVGPAGGAGVPGVGGIGGAAGDAETGGGAGGNGATQSSEGEGGSQPGEPASGQPDPSAAGERPEPSGPEHAESQPSGNTTAGQSDPQSGEPEPTQPEGPQPESPQPETSQPETPQPETSQPEGNEAEPPQPEDPKPEDPKPEDPTQDDPGAPGPSAEPAPLLELPKDHRFVVPEFIGEGPTQRVRVHAAAVGGAGGERAGTQTGGQRRPEDAPPAKPPAPDTDTFRRAEENARAARHVPEEERRIVRRFFELLREAAK